MFFWIINTFSLKKYMKNLSKRCKHMHLTHFAKIPNKSVTKSWVYKFWRRSILFSFSGENFKRSPPRGIFVNLSKGWKQKVSLKALRAFLCQWMSAVHCDVLFPNRNHPLPLPPDGTTHPLDPNYPRHTHTHTCLLFPLILLLSLFSR